MERYMTPYDWAAILDPKSIGQLLGVAICAGAADENDGVEEETRASGRGRFPREGRDRMQRTLRGFAMSSLAGGKWG